MIVTPIWKDYLVDLTPYLDNGKVQYTIERIIDEDADIIFYGTAYALNGSCSIRINEIVRDYLAYKDISMWSASGMENEYYPVFIVRVNNERVGDYVQFYPSWDYKSPDYDRLDEISLNAPITNEVCADVPIPVVSLETDIMSYGFASSREGAKVIEMAVPRALYYTNALGGWDCVLVKTLTRKAEIESEDYKREFQRTLPASRETVVISNDIRRRYACGLGRMNDNEVSRLHHLLESTQVYLWDMERGFQPVTITDKAPDYSTYKQNGKQPREIFVNVELAQRRMRR